MNIKIDNSLFKELLLKAEESPRKRSNTNLHDNPDDSVQKMCVALKKGTYVRPHYHPNQKKWEVLLILRGQANVYIFNKDGIIDEKFILGEGESISGVEIKPNTWHTLVPVSDDVIMFEVKEGPYTPAETSDFAEWAPEEGDEKVESFLKWIESAEVGESYI